jgi:hypothetical protein
MRRSEYLFHASERCPRNRRTADTVSTRRYGDAQLKRSDGYATSVGWQSCLHTGSVKARRSTQSRTRQSILSSRTSSSRRASVNAVSPCARSFVVGFWVDLATSRNLLPAVAAHGAATHAVTVLVPTEVKAPTHVGVADLNVVSDR